MVEVTPLPARFAVALAAVAPEGAPVHVFIGMAGNAGPLDVEKAPGQVTILAEQRPMLAEQRKLRERVVVAHVHDPGDVVVAALAGTAELSLMRIVAVTGGTGGRQRIRQRSGMAGFAGQLLMTAKQLEAGRRRVLEQAVCPGAGVVTVAALRAIAPLVNVILPMAAVAAVRRRTGRAARRVTARTARCEVCTRQRKTCL